MIWIAYIAFMYLTIRFLVVLFNLIRFPVVKDHECDEEPKVSICIPVRNEARNINRLLDSVFNLEYKNLEIVVYNDLS